MTSVKCDKFDWHKLIELIKNKNVIPVIGQNLYRIETEDKREVLLYDFLAGQIAQEFGVELSTDAGHKFAELCLDFFEKYNPDKLAQSNSFNKTLKRVQLIPFNSIWKLAHIEDLNIFITTVYDNFLSEILKEVRKIQARVLSYTVHEKYLHLLDDELFDDIEKYQCSLVYHMFGNFGDLRPAYTEKDKRDTILEFHKDMELNRQNNLSRKLKNSSLLLLGCDDRFLRSFIPVFEKYYRTSHNQRLTVIVGGIPGTYNEKKFNKLINFLKDYKVEFIYYCESKDFVDCLSDRMKEEEVSELLEDRIPVCKTEKKGRTKKVKELENVEPLAFISHHGGNKAASKRLATHLKSDGINVWLDQFELKPGDGIDETIMNAIDKCPVFIPIISRESENLAGTNDLRYHSKEWVRAIENMKLKKNPNKIMPVIIDDTFWMYKDFKNLFHIKIPNGDKVGDYEKLKKSLLDIKEEIPVAND
ncbi:MAG: toll/interleukin-1 receptor domain-containing protein [Candidatus Aminicenantes bacterium]|nr:toll/interleukin-1 receptor domain-containing protein [Candidatus Aminicenantes bacterium]